MIMRTLFRAIPGTSIMAIAGVVLSAGTPAPAQAQTGCDSRASIVDQLRDDYREAPVAYGLEQSGSVVEVLISENGQSWTVLITRPDGITCIAAAGQHWQEVESAPIGETES